MNNQNLLFFAADTMGVTLYQLEGTLKGKEQRVLKLGPWKIPLSVTVTSDLSLPNAVTFWMTLADAIPLYVIIKEGVSWILVLDKLALREAGAKTGFDGQTLKARLKDIHPALKTTFQWVPPDKWSKVEYSETLLGA